eukprot:SAG11_NODE_686_length_7720_cov_1.748327_1_plen_52_part_00
MCAVDIKRPAVWKLMKEFEKFDEDEQVAPAIYTLETPRNLIGPCSTQGSAA